jgi:serine/threonine protein kinase
LVKKLSNLTIISKFPSIHQNNFAIFPWIYLKMSSSHSLPILPPLISTNFDEKYEIIDNIFIGVFGKVHIVKTKNNKKFIAKFIYKKSFIKFGLLHEDSNGDAHEKLMMEFIKSKQIPKIIDYYKTEHNYIIVMKRYSMDLKKMFDENINVHIDTIQIVFRGMTEILKKCHKNSLVHRDVKLNNFLWYEKKKRVMLIDFGLAWDCSTGKCKNFPGTLSHISPEVLFEEKEYNGKKADVWSLGICFYEIICNDYPFNIYVPNIHLNQFQNINYAVLINKENYFILINLIFSMFDLDPKKRISMRKVLKTLETIVWDEELIPKCKEYLLNAKKHFLYLLE